MHRNFSIFSSDVCSERLHDSLCLLLPFKDGQSFTRRLKDSTHHCCLHNTGSMPLIHQHCSLKAFSSRQKLIPHCFFPWRGLVRMGFFLCQHVHYVSVRCPVGSTAWIYREDCFRKIKVYGSSNLFQWHTVNYWREHEYLFYIILDCEHFYGCILSMLAFGSHRRFACSHVGMKLFNICSQREWLKWLNKKRNYAPLVQEKYLENWRSCTTALALHL